MLLDANADADARCRSSVAGELSALQVAAAHGHADAVAPLFAAAADVNVLADFNLGDRTFRGMSTVAIASLFGHARTAKALLAAGADPFTPCSVSFLFGRDLT